MNIVFIYTDEQRADTMAAYGNQAIQTPNMNRLAREGVVCERAYCTQPVCTPSRFSIHTGLYPHAAGCPTNNQLLGRDVRCLPEYLPKGKYVSGHVGKWHLGDEVFAQHGFDEWISSEDGYYPYYSEGRDRDAFSDYKTFLVKNGFPPVTTRSVVACMSEQFSKAHFVGQQAGAFIRRHQQRPFVLYASFLEPHMPFYGPRNDQYEPSSIPLPGNFANRPGPRNHLKYQLFAEAWRKYGFGRMQNIKSEMAFATEVEFPLRDDAHWQRVIANYWGLVSMVDTAVGHILQTLDDCQLQDDTLVVFTSDHGDQMGSHGLLGKMVQYEESVRVPLIFKLPGRRSRGVSRVVQPVSLVDVLPTLLDFLDQPIPGDLHGQSLAPVLADGRAPENDHVFIEWNGADSGFGNYDTEVEGVFPDRVMQGVTGEQEKAAVADPIRTVISPDGWKLNVSAGDFGSELYDLNQDPLEQNNQIGDSQSPAVVQRLFERLVDWQQRTGDTTELPDPDLLRLAV